MIFGGVRETNDLDDVVAAHGVLIRGAGTSTSFGNVLSRLGDVNGDGIEDIFIGAVGDDGNGLNAGAGYVVFGQAASQDFAGGAGDETAVGGLGADSLSGGAGKDTLSGLRGADILDGGDGNDVLSGGGEGGDKLFGGLGNDVYLVGAGDTASEGLNEGFDIVRTDLDGWVLGANFEGLELQGSGDIGGSGNSGTNNLQGNSGANRLDGGAGVDTINGNDGDDIVIGGLGNDLLRGGTGADTFRVDHAFGAALETDQVYDFSAAEGDIIDLSDAFAGTIAVVSGFSKQAGQLVLTFAGGVTTLKLGVTGDGKVDYQMKVNGDVTGESEGWLL